MDTAPSKKADGSSPTSAGRLSIGTVALTVHEIDRVRLFYETVVGLALLSQDGETAKLGTEGNVLLELRRDTAARRRSPREAGLFHTAFLLPSHTDLGRWSANALVVRAPIVGASDHGVSEAIYLSDPEGNGVEIYADRPAATWTWINGTVDMVSEALDVGGLLAVGQSADPWTGAPAGTTVGHVHLQVGALAPAEAFYAGELGLDITCRYPGATFFAANGYHHHIATNIWNSRGAEKRSYPSTGLAEVELRLDAELGERRSLADPWGNAITLTPSQKK